MRSTQANVLSLAFLSSLALTDAAVVKRAPPPQTLPGGWTYQGCYVDIPARTINGAFSASAAMTNQMCTAFCASRGFAYAGTEYHQECFCGSALAPGGVLANEADCSTPCGGDATQPCGGGNRLTLYYTTQVSGPVVNPGVNEYNSIGCYREGTTGRALTFAPGGITGGMTVAKCTAACRAANYILAGVEYAGECYCGNTIANGGAPAVDGCNMLCSGNSTEYCGGGDRLNVYNFRDQYPVSRTTTTTLAATSTSTVAPTTTSRSTTTSVVVASSSTSTVSQVATTTSRSTSTAPSSTPTGPSQPAAVGGYTWYGCMTEGTGIRALNAKTFADDTMTLEKCATFCAGYTYWGVEYSRECYCGNKFEVGSVLANGQCNMRCMGNTFQYCGDGNRLSVYSLTGGPASSSSSAVVTTSNTVLTATTVSTTSSAAPIGTGYPAGWTAQGCWVDGAQGRILTHQAPDSATLTLQSCSQYCFGRGYKIAGAEYHTQCFCGDAIINGGVQATNQADCNTPCGGNTAQMCGGGNRMSIISNGPPVVYGPPTAQKSGFNGKWEYIGCYESLVPRGNENVRVFYWQNIFPGTMTPNQCLDRCSSFGYAAAGLEYGQECYCGDFANIAAMGGKQAASESECNVICAGNSSAICGGGSRMTTYRWNGAEPLYEWSFPQDPAQAGAYELLIGGVCIPLMTMQSVTGKVTFLEKSGTGPPNSTGAYELDLSLTNDFSRAWREMHVKTDVFCAAGVILPDKAGRQLTIGGWSGDSTYGVRLYWPDGQPGGPSVNDWQEDVSKLKLQAGRWYPSAMIMANGSIMVIGGEEGSNGAAVPSIEILPYTGTAPLYMDWLDRTDPNNLYPFVAVLPSQDIFVAYWNEARILDKTTFATKTVLPNAPGAVNNPMGGRTYPLEGTGVLLPQRYPYTDPLGVLICGGSTEGAATALDNCVSIYPEAPTPEWKLERMPSRRVISCMAPLPDGTYLINNGAQHGVAGFGLAQDPNLSALLYDPKKPLGKRITVMANTTIARLYHSESITLLDGRVLVTGSDPDDGVHPQEYRVEVFKPPYLTSGKTRPTFTLTNTDWTYNQQVTFTIGHAPVNGAIEVSLLGAVSSTHGNSMGARTIFPRVVCTGLSCTVTAPPTAGHCPPGWYQFFVLDGGIPAVGVYVRIGGDPAGLGNWPNGPGLENFKRPGL